MSEWALRDLEQEMSAAFDLPVWVENNGSAAAVGESLYGAGKRIRDFAYIYIAVGIGGGVIVDGALMRGFRGNAGEFTGVLPAAIRGDRPTLSLLLEMVRERGTPIGSISELIDRFDPTWPGVEAWLERTRGPLMAILSAIGAVADPEAIVIGGRAPRALAALIVERADYYQEKLRDLERPLPLLLAAEADGDAAALGAAALPLKQHFFG
jgi:predicted NBD/HSP70 family sugar kinase